MSKHVKHVPKHRAPRPPRATALPTAGRTVRNAMVLSGVAVAATGVTVTGGLIGSGSAPASATADASMAAARTTVDTGARAEASDAVLGAVDLADRAPVVSRSDRRTAADPVKRAALDSEVGRAMTSSEDLSQSDPRDIGRALLADFGFSSDQFSCLDSLYTRESGWSVTADNPTSSAYGIPQALPGSKMASAGSDWATNPVTQIKWGLGYIADRYGSPCGAWGHSQSHGWY